MLAHRLQSWPGTDLALVGLLVFAGKGVRQMLSQQTRDVGQKIRSCWWANIKPTLGKRLVLLSIKKRDFSINVGLLLVHYLKRWPSIAPALADCLVMSVFISYQANTTH